MRFDLQAIEPIHQKMGLPSVTCCCGFCKGKLMRNDIKHYKLYSKDKPEREYYLNIDFKNKEVELSLKC